MALGLALWSCDDDETGNGTTSATGTPTGGAGGTGGNGVAGAPGGGGGSGGAGGQAPATEGKITISASGLAAHDGDQLIVSVLAPDQSDTLGGICETISGGSATAVASEIPGLDQCVLGAEIVFAPDSYPVFAGIYPTGSPTPEVCISATATVDGNVTVELPAFVPCG